MNNTLTNNLNIKNKKIIYNSNIKFGSIEI